MSDIRPGQILTNVPDLPGRWSVWSKASSADYGSSSFFVLPVDGHSDGGYAVVRATQGPHDAHPKLELKHRETAAQNADAHKAQR